MWAEKVVQPLLVSVSELNLATECVGMILKIDDLVSRLLCLCLRSLMLAIRRLLRYESVCDKTACEQRA
jgi:hypothetical protein